MKRDVLAVLRDAYCRHVGIEYTHILEPEQQRWLEERVEIKHVKPPVAEQKYILSKLNAAETGPSCKPNTLGGASRWKVRRPPSRRWMRSSTAAPTTTCAR